jgi:hypothetical protein
VVGISDATNNMFDIILSSFLLISVFSVWLPKFQRYIYFVFQRRLFFNYYAVALLRFRRLEIEKFTDCLLIMEIG